MYRMNQIVKMIRANGSALVVLGGERIEIGFAGSGHAELVMVGGGYYFVRTANGRRFEIAKGQLVEVAPAAAAAAESDDLDGLTFSELMEIAKRLKVPGRGVARKPQLIEGIRARRSA